MRAIGVIKRAAATAGLELKSILAKRAKAIRLAFDEVIQGKCGEAATFGRYCATEKFIE